MPSVVIIGPAHPLRGGLASYDERLAREFQVKNWTCCIYTFSLQYPSFLFPGTTQYSEEPPPKDLKILVKINSINPLNWFKVGQELKSLKPDLIVVRFWLPFMGPCLGTILRQVKKNNHTKIICIADNVIPHEKRMGDTMLTNYFIKPIDAFITMSEKVNDDLKNFINHSNYKVVDHPLYDNFGDAVDKLESRKRLRIPANEKIVLFFGFIRKYKGLDLLLQALTLKDMKESGVKVLVAGEFYEDATWYKEFIKINNLGDQLYWHTHFISDSEVKYYLSACDVVIQPYRNATQSGVTPLAYHFEKPMIVSNVGALPRLVPHNKVGLVCEPDPQSIANSIQEYFRIGEAHFLPYLRIEKQKLSWSNLVDQIMELANDIQK
ncbi:MAG: glycosyltransferase [Bacteroidota bacterium]|nr:glycosyltransferase [Bacteroidota bacterium]